jgi:hypothetical protein
MSSKIQNKYFFYEYHHQFKFYLNKLKKIQLPDRLMFLEYLDGSNSQIYTFLDTK